MQQFPQIRSLGGMCFVKNLLVETVGETRIGQSGPFDWAATLPETVRHILADNFKEFFSECHLRVVGSREGRVQHTFYEDKARTMLQRIISGLHPLNLQNLQPVFGWLEIPPMFKHPPKGEGVEGLIHQLRRRVYRLREFLCDERWKVMVWGVAIPYDIIKYAEQVISQEIKEQASNLFEELKRQTQKFALVVLCIVNDVPVNEEGIKSCRQVLSDWNAQQQVCLMYTGWFSSSCTGAKFWDQHVPPGTAAKEKNEVKTLL